MLKHIAVSDWDPEVARQLLEKGASLDPATISGYTPLMLAATHEKRRMCEFLITKGANVNSNALGASFSYVL
jgi:ankyrin repeat protein